MGKSAQSYPLESKGTAGRLRAALLRLAMDRDELLAQVRQTVEDEASLMQLLVREIDEVVLPRKIAIRSDGETIAMLTTSNRRLIELQIDGADLLPLTDEEPDSDTVARFYAQSIKSLGDKAGSISLQPAGRASQSATNTTACSAARLAEVAETVSRANQMHTFLDVVQARTLGWILHLNQDRNSRRDGGEDVLLRLAALQAIIADRRDTKGQLSRLDRAGPSCVAVALAPGMQAIIAKDGNDSFLAAVPQVDVVSVVEDWQAIFGTANRT